MREEVAATAAGAGAGGDGTLRGAPHPGQKRSSAWIARPHREQYMVSSPWISTGRDRRFGIEDAKKMCRLTPIVKDCQARFPRHKFVAGDVGLDQVGRQGICPPALRWGGEQRSARPWERDR